MPPKHRAARRGAVLLRGTNLNLHFFYVSQPIQKRNEEGRGITTYHLAANENGRLSVGENWYYRALSFLFILQFMAVYSTLSPGNVKRLERI